MMRPFCSAKPQQRAVIYTDLQAIADYYIAGTTMGISVGVATTTNFAKITWWDGSTEIVDCLSATQTLGGTVSKGMAFKTVNNNNLKKIIAESCDSTGKLAGNITMFTCDRRIKFPTGTKITQQVNQIDVSTCQQLKVLKCDRNILTSLGDIKACKNISSISCGGNCFASLDVSQLSSLEQFFCNNNPNLTSLTIGSNLKRLGASSCAFTGISFPNGSQLYQLFLKDSLLTGITLDNLTNLVWASLNAGFTTSSYPNVVKNTPNLTTISGNTLTNLTRFTVGNYNYCGNLQPNTKISSIRLQGSGTGGVLSPTVGNITIEPGSKVLILSGSSLSTSALNTLYTDLKDITGGTPITIYVGGITGFAGSNITTATSKNYLFGPTCI